MIRVKVNDINTLKKKLAPPLAIFGLGDMGQSIGAFLLSNDIPVDYFADNNCAEAVVAGKAICAVTPERLYALSPNCNVIVASNIYFGEMMEQLLAIGFARTNLHSWNLFCEKNDWKDLQQTANWARMNICTAALSKFIIPGCKNVVDLGAGKMFLKTLIAPSIEYFPFDYEPHSPDIIHCDLNESFPPITADVFFASRLMEFITNDETLVINMCKAARRQILMSYVILENFPDIAGREVSGYRSHRAFAEIVGWFDEYGFKLQNIKTDPAAPADILFNFIKE